MSESKKQKMVTSPKGRAVWPKLNEPDTRFEPDGVYKVSLVVPAAEAKALIAALTKEFDAYYAAEVKEAKKKLKKADLPWSDVMNDAGEETGEVEFSFKMAAQYTTKKGEVVQQRPVLFDAKTRPMTDRVGGGSIIRVGFEPHFWNVPATGVGLSLRMKAVQVLELKQWSPSEKKASDFGFSEEEGFETAFNDEGTEGPQGTPDEEPGDGAGF
jgi:hypothetical protein